MSSVCEARWSDGSDALRLILGRECWSNSIEDRICERDQQSYTALHTHTHSERQTHAHTHSETNTHTHRDRHTNTRTETDTHTHEQRQTNAHRDTQSKLLLSKATYIFLQQKKTFIFFVSTCVPWESNPQPLQCSTTEPQEHMYTRTETHRERETPTHTQMHTQRETHKNTSLKL